MKIVFANSGHKFPFINETFSSHIKGENFWLKNYNVVVNEELELKYVLPESFLSLL